MKSKKITGIKLAKLSGISPEHISKMKKGHTQKIELDTIDKLLVSLDIEPNDLFKYIKE